MARLLFSFIPASCSYLFYLPVIPLKFYLSVVTILFLLVIPILIYLSVIPNLFYCKLFLSYWKLNFPMTPHVRLSVGWLLGLSICHNSHSPIGALVSSVVYSYLISYAGWSQRLNSSWVILTVIIIIFYRLCRLCSCFIFLPVCFFLILFVSFSYLIYLPFVPILF